MKLFKFLFFSRRTLARVPLLIRSERVPLRLKLLALAAALFIISPLNILGDIPLLGIADDAALLALLLQWFIRKAEAFEGPGYGEDTSKQILIASR